MKQFSSNTMQKPITVTQSDFLAIVNNLNLRFPLAEIVDKTGLDKGTVSKVLNKKLPPSDKFLSKFAKGFELPPMIYALPSTTDRSLRIALPDAKDELIRDLKEKIARLETQVEKLTDLLFKASGKP